MKKYMLLLLVISLLGEPAWTDDNPSPKPESRVEIVSESAPENLHRVDRHLYRSAQPDRGGMRTLAQMGIQNILNLRQYHSDDDEAKGNGLKLYHVKMNAGSVKDEDVIAALRIIKRAEGPILVHCWHGSDRTGTIVAMYRMVFQNWSKKEALDELVNGGFGYHRIYANIPEYIEKVDVDHIRRQVGIGSDAEAGLDDASGN